MSILVGFVIAKEYGAKYLGVYETLIRLSNIAVIAGMFGIRNKVLKESALSVNKKDVSQTLYRYLSIVFLDQRRLQ